MDIQLPEDLRRVKQVLVLEDSGLVSNASRRGIFSTGTQTHFFAFHANSGKFRIIAIQYPLMTNKKVRKAWTAASGTM